MRPLADDCCHRHLRHSRACGPCASRCVQTGYTSRICIILVWVSAWECRRGGQRLASGLLFLWLGAFCGRGSRSGERRIAARRCGLSSSYLLIPQAFLRLSTSSLSQAQSSRIFRYRVRTKRNKIHRPCLKSVRYEARAAGTRVPKVPMAAAIGSRHWVSQQRSSWRF